MGECPQCGVELKYLENEQSGTKTFRMYVKKDEPKYEEKGFDTDDEINQWVCPECYKVVAYSEENAIKLITNKQKSNKQRR